MKFLKTTFLFLVFHLLSSCGGPPDTSRESIEALLTGSPAISGREEYLASPYVTAGDRVYMVGHQDGSFPPLGWHIKGEMGGIWDHPIKLMDGFRATLIKGGRVYPLDRAARFTNYPMANRHRYRPDSIPVAVDRYQFVPDGKQGLAVIYELYNTGPSTLELEFEFTGYADLRPTWLGERTRMVDSTDLGTYDPGLPGWVFRDSGNPWFLAFGSDSAPLAHGESDSPYNPTGRAGSLRYGVELGPGSGKTLVFAIAGSYHSQQEAGDTFGDILEHWRTYLEEKRDRYADLASRSRLTTPDTLLNKTFEWLKYNCDWLVREVPETGRGITAGIPDYPWWFGVDSEYALQGYMAIGQWEAAFETIHLLDSVSGAVNGNGRIIHEMSTNGAVFNPGNINETPQFATLIWRVYQWTGDRAFLEKYFPTIRKGLEWLLSGNDANGNGFPDGFGMMEIHGLNSEMIDVAVYTQAAFSHASLIAQELGETTLAAKYLQKAMELRRKINDEFWSEAFGSYADFMGTDSQALHLIEDAMVRADTLGKPWAVEELEKTRERILSGPGGDSLKPFVLHHNWVVNTPMEMGIADRDKALTALETARKFTNPFGVFVTGIDRDETAGQDDGSFRGSKVFSYTGAVMTLPTGVQAIAENNYGRPDQALDYLRRMARSFSYALPGSMYEVSPDYGMMVQAWNIYSFAVPIVRQFFGIEPMASRQEIRLRPQMPSSWPRASLENVAVGDNHLSVHYTKSGGYITLRVEQEQPDWRIGFDLGQLPPGEVEVLSGKTETLLQEGNLLLQGRGALLEIRYPEK